MSVASAKVPAVIATGIICLLVGGGAGAVAMSYAVKTEHPSSTQTGDEEGTDGAKGGAKGEAKGGKGGGKGGKGGKGGAPGGGGQRGPNSKAQLAQLVSKLDVLTKKPLTVELTADQKKQVKELLAGLEAKDELSEEEAKAKFDALLGLVESQRETLEAAGYRWPGAPGGMGPGGGGMGPGGQPPANPFKSGDAADRLKSLQTTLNK
jgi:hypothetical protein